MQHAPTWPHTLARCAALFAVVAVIACDDPVSSPPEDTPDLPPTDLSQELDPVDTQDGDDLDPTDTPPEDADAPELPLDPCAPEALARTPFALFPDLPATQIHLSLAPDGEGRGFWVAFSLPQNSGNFSVHVAHLGCDGAYRVAPVQVSPGLANELDPAILVAPEWVMVAWQVDDGQQPHNLSIHYRFLLPDGTVEGEQSTRLVLTQAGEAFQASAWMPQLVMAPSGDPRLIGVLADPTLARFQVFHQAFNGRVPEGDTLLVAPEAETSQFYPAASYSGEGQLYVAFDRAPDTGADDVAITRFNAAGVLDFDPPYLAFPEWLSRSPSLHSGSGVTLLATGGKRGSLERVLLRHAHRDPSQASPLLLGNSGQKAYAPAVVVSEAERAAVLWYEPIVGQQHNLWWQAIRIEGEEVAMHGAPRQLNLDPVAPYPPALIHFGDGIYLAAWSQGTSPGFRAFARFVP